MVLTIDQIDENTKINDLIESFPYLAEYLQDEYGFHCVNCILNSFDTLKNGAEIHGIVDEEFEELLKNIKSYIKSFESEELY